MEEELNILSPNTFYKIIEDIVYDLDVTYLEAVIHYCETNDLEMETVSELIRKNSLLKNNIQLEAEDLNLVNTKTARLPF